MLSAALRRSLASAGMIALRVTLSTVLPPASSAAKAKMSTTGGSPVANVSAARPAADSAIAIWAASIRLRRSKRSAAAPPSSESTTIGTSSTIPSSPTSAAEPVSV